MKVSIITPTSPQRRKYFLNLYRCFKNQTYSDCELLILENGSSSSKFFTELQDNSVKYIYINQEMTIGEKRNYLIQKAVGEWIVHFDDDDFYAPHYVESVVQFLKEYDFITLSGWYAYAPQHDFFCYWDTAQIASYHFNVKPNSKIEVFSLDEVDPQEKQSWMNSNLWGFGFSYAYRKEVFESIRFDFLNFGEDLNLIEKLVSSDRKLIHVPDQEGLVLHLIHNQNMSGIFPQFVLPSFLLPQIFGLEILEFLLASQAESTESV